MNELAGRLVQWYRGNMVPYPWRRTDDPYRIWLSEILLQQTRIAVVLRYYEKMLQHFPTLESLAAAEYEEFARVWSGIGYYSRARNMHACARQVISHHGGIFPGDTEALKALPGFGPYTAGALRNLVFKQLTPAVDANVARVLARLSATRLPPKSSSFRAAVEEKFLEYGKDAPASEYFQGLMELGERICLPRPRCEECPLQMDCSAHRENVADAIPARIQRPITRPFHWYFLIVRKGGRFYMIQNSNREFLKDAWLFPDILSETELSRRQLQQKFQKAWKIAAPRFSDAGTTRHAVTFRRITCHVLICTDHCVVPGGGKWIAAGSFAKLHTSSVVDKVLSLLAR